MHHRSDCSLAAGAPRASSDKQKSAGLRGLAGTLFPQASRVSAFDA
ncbi:hypothetical protein NBRC111894_3662 [Sporolactobacillus inulinus]|uniref:Uncharacterized protein n=1 Tax=Sporolactobacillus inulinus TaxID=2078 RepID=A0A4Y1ZIC3_9BACL|nr:hypothetical protein NBRC111894_3662 [Sporolactobacillus inulinus]